MSRQPYGSDTMSTHALMRSAVMQLTRWGLRLQILQRRERLQFDRPRFTMAMRPFEWTSSRIMASIFCWRHDAPCSIRCWLTRPGDAGAAVRHGVALSELQLPASNGRVVGASLERRQRCVQDRPLGYRHRCGRPPQSTVAQFVNSRAIVRRLQRLWRRIRLLCRPGPGWSALAFRKKRRGGSDSNERWSLRLCSRSGFAICRGNFAAT